jgi:hypothetical protein
MNTQDIMPDVNGNTFVMGKNKDHCHCVSAWLD